MRATAERALRRTLLATAFLGATALSAAATDSVTLTLPQARAAAQAALADGDYPLAIQLARGLLQANEKDAQAYYIIALAYQRTGDAYLARRAAGYAFRYSTDSRDRYIASQLATGMAVAEKRYTLAQYWLRRSYDHVPDERLRRQAEADFGRLRALNPWSARLTFSVVPSDNVNSGTDDPWRTIEGSDTIGSNSVSAQRLSGMAATADVRVSYRLSASQTSQTHLEFRGYTRQVFLSQASRQALDTSPNSADHGLRGNDFSTVNAEFGLRHHRVAGPSGQGGFYSFGLRAGQQWYGGDPYSRYATGEVKRLFALSETRTFSLSASFEARSYVRSSNPAYTTGLRADYSVRMATGARIDTGLLLSHTESKRAVTGKNGATAYVTFSPAERIGPARLGLTLGATWADYPNYTSILGAPVPGGRQDNGAFANLDLQFDSLGYAGFAPTLTLQGRRNNSTDSRFDTSEVSVSIGIRSNF